MKFGIRTPSLKRSISARTTGAAKRAIKRAIIPGYGKKGMGWLHNPKKAAYNAIYHRATVSISDLFKLKSPQNTGSNTISGAIKSENINFNPEPNFTEKWYKRAWACILFLILFSPLGIFLMYKYHKDWKKPLRISIDVVSSIWFVFWMIGIISVANTNYPQQLQLTNSIQTIDLQEKVSLKIKVTPSDSNTDNVKFISDNTSVATFNRDDQSSDSLTGIITGLSEGTTQVYVSYNDSVVSNKIEITVEDKAKKAALQKQADEVISQINALGTITLESENSIKAARESYDLLPDEAKTLINNYDILTNAETTLNKAKQEQIKSDAAKVQKAISAIGTVSLESESAISSARKQYDSLPEESKNLVTNYAILTAAETSLQNQKDAKAKQDAAAKTAAEKAATQKQASNNNSFNITGNGSSTPDEPTGQTVYWTPSGEKYHVSRDCPTLKRSKSIISGTLEEAKDAGKTDPCKVCNH